MHCLGIGSKNSLFKFLQLKDGVVDLKEFSRWYFTGLKSYNDGKRNMLLLGNAGLSLSKALAAN